MSSYKIKLWVPQEESTAQHTHESIISLDEMLSLNVISVEFPSLETHNENIANCSANGSRVATLPEVLHLYGVSSNVRQLLSKDPIITSTSITKVHSVIVLHGLADTMPMIPAPKDEYSFIVNLPIDKIPKWNYTLDYLSVEFETARQSLTLMNELQFERMLKLTQCNRSLYIGPKSLGTYSLSVGTEVIDDKKTFVIRCINIGVDKGDTVPYSAIGVKHEQLQQICH